MHAVALLEKPTEHEPGAFKSGVRPTQAFFGPSVGGVVVQRKGACTCGGGCPTCVQDKDVVSIQPKLKISSPDDVYEREADQVADQVMGGAELLNLHPISSMADVQRIATNESPSEEDAVVIEDEESIDGNGSELQRLASNNPKHDTQPRRSWNSYLSGSSGAGRPLDTNVRTFMEDRFQTDFRDVRVHDDSEASRMSNSIGARAFTHASDIYFGTGEYAPESEAGRRVLAHELTHVIQQGGGGGKTRDLISPLVHRETDETKIHRMAALNPANRVEENVHPWPPRGPTGTDYIVQTDAGSNVLVWKAYSPWRIDWHYWCHGHSLGTFDRFGYTVYSGRHMAQVVADEWTPVASASARPGDIAVFTNYQHSARFVSPVVTGGVLDESASTLSTKNGPQAPRVDSLTNVRAAYPRLPTYGVFRHR